jgi:hypothetical protein
VSELTKRFLIEICNHCGKDVSRGSGNFVNRVHDLNDLQTRIDNNRIAPTGDFVCEDCDNNSLTDND